MATVHPVNRHQKYTECLKTNDVPCESTASWLPPCPLLHGGYFIKKVDGHLTSRKHKKHTAEAELWCLPGPKMSVPPCWAGSPWKSKRGPVTALHRLRMLPESIFDFTWGLCPEILGIVFRCYHFIWLDIKIMLVFLENSLSLMCYLTFDLPFSLPSKNSFSAFHYRCFRPDKSLSWVT